MEVSLPIIITIGVITVTFRDTTVRQRVVEHVPRREGQTGSTSGESDASKFAIEIVVTYQREEHYRAIHNPKEGNADVI